MKDDKKYGGTASFFGILVLICIGLITYYINFIPKFEELNQTYDSISMNASVFEKYCYKYLAIFDKLFGKTPSTPVLSFFIPLTLILIVVFLFYLYKFTLQKKQEKIKKSFEDNFKSEASSEGEKNNDQSTIQG